jgi:drug/metabolite transporter (DMT)-like permease
MSQKNIIKGVFLVGLGASSYGMLATFVKLAYLEGYTTAEVTISQFALGILGLLIINSFQRFKKNANTVAANTKNISQLMIAGTSLGLTSIFYYLAVRYIPVSIGIVLLMQTVWMGVLLESILDKKFPNIRKTIAVIIVLTGTTLATKVFEQNMKLDWRGLLWGILAAASFTTTMFTSNRIALSVSTAQRSLYMLLGGAIVVIVFAIISYHGVFQWNIFYKWGLVLALFGTIIPPMLLNAGFPHTGIGLGSVVAAIELPVSVMMAYFLLYENVSLIQWFGIILILAAIVLINISYEK